MKLLLHVALLLCLFLLACGTPGAPRPPSLQLPRPADDLAATRKGDKVTLTWTPSSENTDGTLVQRPGPTRICRAANEFPLNACAQPVAEVPTAPALRTGAHPRATYTDTLPPQMGQQSPIGLATYAVEIMNRRGRSAGLSNQVRVPLAPAPPPASISTSEVRPEGVLLVADATTAAMPEGVRFEYHLFRRAAETPTGVDLGAAEVTVKNGRSVLQLADHSVEWEKTYFYHVTPVVTVAEKGKPIAQFEGDNSPEDKVFVHDTFPPAAPVGLQAVFSGVGQKPFIDLTWASNQEADLAGYNVYRRENGGEWTRLNRDLVTAPSFRDSDVALGHAHEYAVAALDLRNNESAKSEPAGESVPNP